MFGVLTVNGQIALPIVGQVHSHAHERKKRQQKMGVLRALGMQLKYKIATQKLVRQARKIFLVLT